MVKVFVYGTLQRGGCRNDLLQEQQYLGAAVTLPLYRLYDLGDYPGLVADQDGRNIEGEVWEIDQQCLQVLDRVENVPILYHRALVNLDSVEFDDVQAYLYQGDVSDARDCGVKWTR